MNILGAEKNEGAAVNPPSSKRQKVNRQVDSTGFNMQRSNRDQHPTTKAADER
jgi:hypothetical protein